MINDQKIGDNRDDNASQGGTLSYSREVLAPIAPGSRMLSKHNSKSYIFSKTQKTSPVSRAANFKVQTHIN